MQALPRHLSGHALHASSSFLSPRLTSQPADRVRSIKIAETSVLIKITRDCTMRQLKHPAETICCLCNPCYAAFYQHGLLCVRAGVAFIDDMLPDCTREGEEVRERIDDHRSPGKPSCVVCACACLYLRTSSAEVIAFRRYSLPLLLAVTSSTLLYHSFTSRRGREGTLRYVILLSIDSLN